MECTCPPAWLERSIFGPHRQPKHTICAPNSKPDYVVKISRRSASLDPNCTCHVCQNYDRAYLHHLFKAQSFCATAHDLPQSPFHDPHHPIDPDALKSGNFDHSNFLLGKK
jgi:hypothetical protein